MADNEDVTRGPSGDAAPESTSGAETAAGSPAMPEPGTSAAQEPLPPAAPAPVLKTRWRDRAWSFRAVLGVAAASLVIGGVAGGVIGAAAGDDDEDGRYRFGPMGQMGPGWRGHHPHWFDDGGPKWRWGDGPQQGPNLQPPTASPSAPTSPGS